MSAQKEPASGQTTAERDRNVLAYLVDTLAEIAFDAGDYDGCDIQADMTRLGVLEQVAFDPARHTDHSGEAVAGDIWFEFSDYGKGLIRVANALRK
jgi:hypothetical protein